MNVAVFHSLVPLPSAGVSSASCPISGSLTRENTTAMSSTSVPSTAYGVVTSPPPAKRKNPPTSGPQIHPSPLNAWARLMRRSLPSGSPNTVTYGFDAVSRQVSPQPITNRASRKNSNDPIRPPGMNSRAPMPYSTSPVSTPVR